MRKPMRPGGDLPVTVSESKKHGVRTEEKYRFGRIKHVEKKWGGRWYNKQASPAEEAGATVLEEGRRMGIYKKKKKK